MHAADGSLVQLEQDRHCISLTCFAFLSRTCHSARGDAKMRMLLVSEILSEERRELSSSKLRGLWRQSQLLTGREVLKG